MNSTFGAVLAQATQSTQPAGGFFQNPLFVPAILVALLIIFMSRNSKKQRKQAEDLRNSMKKGDRVQTIGGILGTVVELRDTDVLIKVDETNNTKIRFSRNAIHRVVSEEDTAEKK